MATPGRKARPGFGDNAELCGKAEMGLPGQWHLQFRVPGHSNELRG